MPDPLTFEQQVTRFQGNEERQQIWTNGTAADSYITNTHDQPVESIRKFMVRKDGEINAAAVAPIRLAPSRRASSTMPTPSRTTWAATSRPIARFVSAAIVRS